MIILKLETNFNDIISIYICDPFLPRPITLSANVHKHPPHCYAVLNEFAYANSREDAHKHLVKTLTSTL